MADEKLIIGGAFATGAAGAGYIALRRAMAERRRIASPHAYRVKPGQPANIAAILADMNSASQGKFERFVAQGKGGKVLSVVDGEKTRIASPRVPTAAKRVIHNHPSFDAINRGGGFSPDDIAFAIEKSGRRPFHVATDTGSIYSMRAGRNAPSTPSAVDGLAKRAQQLTRSIRDEVRASGASAYEARIAGRSGAARVLAKEGAISYRETLSGDERTAVKKYRGAIDKAVRSRVANASSMGKSSTILSNLFRSMVGTRNVGSPFDGTNGEMRQIRPLQRSGRRESVDGKPATFARVDPSKVISDPETFQFKSGGDGAGVTDRLKGVQKWDAVAAGKAVVFERADGTRVIADGHQRLGLAKRLAAEGQRVKMDAYILREADGWNARDVRAYAAMKNIKELSGQALDMAKVMRERPDMVNSSLPMSDAKVQQAKALSTLSNDAFKQVVGGVVKPEHAAAVGEIVKDPARHADMLKEMAKADLKSAQHARLYVQQAVAAPSITERTSSLFGEETTQRSLIKERASVLDRAMTSLKSDKRVFSLLEREAGSIEAAGNKLARSENVLRAEGAGRTAAAIEKLAMTRGRVSSMLDQAARQVAEGTLSPAKAAQAFKTDISKTLRAEGLRGLMADAPEVAAVNQKAVDYRSLGNAVIEAGKAHREHGPNSSQFRAAFDRMDKLDREVRARNGIEPHWSHKPNQGWSDEARAASAEARKGQSSFLADPTTKEQIAAQARQAGKPMAVQQGIDDGLFGSGSKQIDLVDEVRKAEAKGAESMAQKQSRKAALEGQMSGVTNRTSSAGAKAIARGGIEQIERRLNKLGSRGRADLGGQFMGGDVRKWSEMSVRQQAEVISKAEKASTAARMSDIGRGAAAVTRSKATSASAGSVAALKAQAKERGISLTGAKSKAQIQERLARGKVGVISESKYGKGPSGWSDEARAASAEARKPAKAAKPRKAAAAPKLPASAVAEAYIKQLRSIDPQDPAAASKVISAMKADKAANKAVVLAVQKEIATGLPLDKTKKGALGNIERKFVQRAYDANAMKQAKTTPWSILGPAAIAGAAAVAFDATRSQAMAAGSGKTAATAKGIGAATAAGGTVAAIGYGIGKAAQFAAKNSIIAGKVVGRALPAVAVGMAAYEAGKGAVTGYEKDGVIGAMKGAATGVADFATFGAYSHFTTPKTPGRLDTSQKQRFSAENAKYAEDQKAKKKSTRENPGWSDQARINAAITRGAVMLPYGGSPREGTVGGNPNAAGMFSPDAATGMEKASR